MEQRVKIKDSFLGLQLSIMKQEIHRDNYNIVQQNKQSFLTFNLKYEDLLKFCELNFNQSLKIFYHLQFSMEGK